MQALIGDDYWISQFRLILNFMYKGLKSDWSFLFKLKN